MTVRDLILYLSCLNKHEQSLHIAATDAKGVRYGLLSPLIREDEILLALVLDPRKGQGYVGDSE